jgi:phosphate transport system permease protein
MSTENNLARKKRRSQNIAFGIFTATSYAIVGLLFVILAFIVTKGIGVISWEFISAMPENGMTEGGIFPAIIGTLCLVLVSMVFAFPVGVLAAIYMNEYVKDGWPKKIIKQMTNNLAGVPSIVFGLFGMALFVNKLEFGDSILAGGLTLGLLVLPVIIRTTEESLKAVDDTFRQASLGLGASKWETTSKIVFPIAFPNIITGLILSIGRVSGETAPILFTVAAYFLPKLPTSIFDQAMALPYHLYVIATSGTNIEKSRAMAYGTALILIIIVLISNLLANALRKYYGKKVKMN